MKEKIKELLGLNLEASTVALAVGCTESYVSQLISDSDFAAEVQALKLTNFTEHARRDRRYDTLEDTLLEKLEGMVPLMARPETVLRAIAIINAAKRRAVSSTDQTPHQSTTIVALSLPNVLAAKININERNQVVEVEGKTIASMPAKGVARRLEELQQRRSEKSEAVAADNKLALQRIKELTVLEHLPVADLL
jgi:hypothetical protein